MKVISYHQHSEIVQYLIKKDPKLHDLFHIKEVVHVQVNDDYFLSLVHTIIAQQLSSKVANVIIRRIEEHFKHDITPYKIVQEDENQLRSLGLSFQKIKYLKSLATCTINEEIRFDRLDQQSDQEIIDMLTHFKGIGIWSAQMFLMFSLGREDVFSVLDLGLRNSLKRLYQMPDLTQNDIEKIAQAWSPYRSVVAHYLWHAWDA